MESHKFHIQSLFMTVELPTMSGVCRLAVEPKLPMNTVLLGTDFGKENILALLQSVKTEPQPVPVTRAMQSQDNLATHVAEALHASEGGNPLSFDSISYFIPDTPDSFIQILLIHMKLSR